MTVQILHAAFGISPQVEDVTFKVQKMLKEGCTQFHASIDDFGDPAPGWCKYLTIWWRNDDGEHLACTIERGEPITL